MIRRTTLAALLAIAFSAAYAADEVPPASPPPEAATDAQQIIEAAAQTLPAAPNPNATLIGDPEKGKTFVETICLGCHGIDGNSTIAPYPNLAGQFPEYLYKQLRNFKPEEGQTVGLRDNPIMLPMASLLSDEDMRNVAAYFSQQTLKPATAKDPELVKIGEKLWRSGDFKKGIPACAACHGPTGLGLPVQYPRLAGQIQEYTEAQLTTFRIGARANDDNKMMRDIASRLSDQEIKALADYIAGLR